MLETTTENGELPLPAINKTPLSLRMMQFTTRHDIWTKYHWVPSSGGRAVSDSCRAFDMLGKHGHDPISSLNRDVSSGREATAALR
jgi:hypothetical protein